MPKIRLRQTAGGFRIEDTSGTLIADFYASDEPTPEGKQRRPPRDEAFRCAIAAARILNQMPSRNELVDDGGFERLQSGTDLRYRKWKPS